MKKLILIRHGECDGNIEGRFRGRFDFPLNQQGIRQSHELGQLLKKVDFKMIYTSPLKRAKQTADIIATHTLSKVISLETFNNLSLGPWNGELKAVIAKKYPEQYKIWISNPESLTFPGLENLNDVQNRAMLGVKDLRSKHSDETIIVVTHRAVLKPLIAGLLELKSPWFWKIHLDNASITTFELNLNNNYMMTKFNCTDHLNAYVEEKY
ncbi:MAG: hypothetical protein A2381_14300 [Bdellovibrionales bacterium RIFOXYB1_FULL_37_110]|nr:MAG: hypothetical protein A2417_07070 [Bdellovibrionales bacterium RIFOXYC1_FULL_37_79]OFZ57514.1 MAG: hypothetical protein A2381_14300 [Bdellovibrionales bacterium RIFOXYB1_FULL_37_110]OFZ62985.1 MAG: hypothetical protein A2577_07580 [Bdellovibrionales bacterium RIFOXYD1_FULL_36_51]